VTLAPPSGTGTPPSPAAIATRRRSRRRGWAVVIIAAIAVGFLLYRGLASATVYFLTADQAAAKAPQLGDTRFRIEGTVVAGTVTPRADSVLFCIENAGAVVPVDNSGYPPQLFQPNIPVVLEGHFATASAPAPASPTCSAGQHGAPTFVSNLIMVKHTAVYTARHPNRVKNFVGK